MERLRQGRAARNEKFEATPSNTMPDATRKRVRSLVVALIVYEGFQSLDVAGPLEVFTKAGRHLPASVPDPFDYLILIASPNGGTVRSNSGLAIADTIAVADLPLNIDTIMVAGASEPALRKVATETDLLPWMVAREPKTRRIASVCTGAFLLAGCGLLKGRRATTHWSGTEQLRTMFPDIEVDADALFVGDGHVFTSAGVTAGIDLALSFVEADCDRRLAAQTARELVLYLRRAGGQSQYSAGITDHISVGGLQDVLVWISDHLTEDLNNGVLADRAAMSPRSLARVFERETGMTPGRYVELVRLDRAKFLLETTDWPAERVAQRSGFETSSTLARTFKRHLGITPQSYRSRFGH